MNVSERQLSGDEILRIFKELGGLWLYNYDAAKDKTGLHAELKSGRCSDGFFNSEIVLCHDDTRQLIAKQMVKKFNLLHWHAPITHVAGIPNGATRLGEDVAKIMGVKNAKIIKESGKIKMITALKPNDRLLLVEDICTMSTGFKEAVQSTYNQTKDAETACIIPFELVIINRGNLKYVDMRKEVNNAGALFNVLSLAEQRINDWNINDCPLCKKGSGRIKPKESPENWRKLTTSQL